VKLNKLDRLLIDISSVVHLLLQLEKNGWNWYNIRFTEEFLDHPVHVEIVEYVGENK